MRAQFNNENFLNYTVECFCKIYIDHIGLDVLILIKKVAWPSGQRVGLAIGRSWVLVPLWRLSGFVFGCSELKSSASLVNSQLVASC